MGQKMFDVEFTDLGVTMDDALPSPTLVEYYRWLGNRTIVWNDVITDDMMDVPMYILRWNKEDNDNNVAVEDRKPIKIFINSDGGDTNITLFTAEVISLSKTPVITVGMGRAYSSGGLLLMAGQKRLIFDTTSVLIHDGSTGAIGDTGKVLDNLEFTKRMEEKVTQFILAHTNIPEKLMRENYRRDWFLFADEAIKYGIADKIITDICEIL